MTQLKLLGDLSKAENGQAAVKISQKDKDESDEDGPRVYLAEQCSCFPPPVFILGVTLVQILFFVHSISYSGGDEATIPGSHNSDSIVVYRSDKKRELWRFVCYVLLHEGWMHLFFNMVVQLVIGLPLEMVHGSVRVCIVYTAGVIGASLGTTIFLQNVVLVGASGGVYALLAAHVSDVILNYSEMELGILKIIAAIIIASTDTIALLWHEYFDMSHGDKSGSTSSQVGSTSSQVGSTFPKAGSTSCQSGSTSCQTYIAHLVGAVSGLTMGLIVLKNFHSSPHGRVLWWAAVTAYVFSIICAVWWNINA